MRIHEYLEVVNGDGEKWVVCTVCGHKFCQVGENYKQHAAYREPDISNYPRRLPLSGESIFVTYQEYSCPGCGQLLEVDCWCPLIDSEEDKILWDMQLRET